MWEYSLLIIFCKGFWPEDYLSNGGEESSGTETGGGEETWWRNQLLEENQPTVEITVGGHYITKEIVVFDCYNPCVNCWHVQIQSEC